MTSRNLANDRTDYFDSLKKLIEWFNYLINTLKYSLIWFITFYYSEFDCLFKAIPFFLNVCLR